MVVARYIARPARHHRPPARDGAPGVGRRGERPHRQGGGGARASVPAALRPAAARHARRQRARRRHQRAAPSRIASRRSSSARARLWAIRSRSSPAWRRRASSTPAWRTPCRASPGRRLVVDIGGGSTELIIGEGADPARAREPADGLRQPERALLPRRQAVRQADGRRAPGGAPGARAGAGGLPPPRLGALGTAAPARCGRSARPSASSTARRRRSRRRVWSAPSPTCSRRGTCAS